MVSKLDKEIEAYRKSLEVNDATHLRAFAALWNSPAAF
jgi:hypothetical protein